MGNKAKSKELKDQINRKEVDDLKAYASKLYAEEQHRSLQVATGERKKSSRQIWASKAKMDEAKDACNGEEYSQAYDCWF